MTPLKGNTGDETPQKTTETSSTLSDSSLVRPNRVRRTTRNLETERITQQFKQLQETIQQGIIAENKRLIEEQQENLVKLYRSGLDENFIKELASPELEETIVITPKSLIPFDQISSIVKKLADFKDIHTKTSFLAIGELFRRGGSAANASPILSVEVNCTITKTKCVISKADVQNTMQTVLGHQNTRKLAESMAPYLISINLEKSLQGSKSNLKGDLANRLNKKLLKEGQEPLNPYEEICACSYAQWIPDLNSYTSGNRLNQLLQADLEERNRISKLKQKQKNLKPDKNAKKVPQQPAKGRKGKKNMVNYQKKINKQQ